MPCLAKRFGVEREKRRQSPSQISIGYSLPNGVEAASAQVYKLDASGLKCTRALCTDFIVVCVPEIVTARNVSPCNKVGLGLADKEDNLKDNCSFQQRQ